MTVNNEVEVAKIAARAQECLYDGLYFNRYFFKQVFNTRMLINGHHHLIQSALDRTMLPPENPDFISRLIITISPGYGKTQQSVINYIARGLAMNPRNRFLHLSYSHALALQNSASVREIIKSRQYQSMWPVKTKEDTDSKSIWWTEQSGGVYATAAGGQVTGFRAGHMDTDKFSGACLIDDPLKPDDANYEQKRELINNRYNETISSRLAVETVPVIVIMQRLHDNDLVGYLLKGGSGEKWHHLNLPVIIDRSQPYPEEYTHGIPLPHDLPDGWLWPVKHNDKHLTALRSHKRKFAAQYMQAPLKFDEDNCLWSEASIKAAKGAHNSPFRRTIVAVDPAVSHTDKSDQHGIVVVSSHTAKNEYTVRGDYTTSGSPMAWATKAIEVYEKFEADAIVIERNQGGDMCVDTLRNAGFTGRIIQVHATKGKVIRAEPIAALYEQGFVKHGRIMDKLEDELVFFDTRTGKSNGKSPNRLDALVWGLTQLSEGMEMNELLKLVVG